MAPPAVSRIANGHPIRSTTLPAGADTTAAARKNAAVSRPRPTVESLSSGPA